MTERKDGLGVVWEIAGLLGISPIEVSGLLNAVREDASVIEKIKKTTNQEELFKIWNCFLALPHPIPPRVRRVLLEQSETLTVRDLESAVTKEQIIVAFRNSPFDSNSKSGELAILKMVAFLEQRK